MEDIRNKINELLDAHPDLVEKVKSAPGEAADAIRKATGLNLDASDLDKVKGAIRDFAGDDGLDLSDFQRAFEKIAAKAKETVDNIDMNEIATKGTAVAADLVAKGSAVAAGIAAKGEEVAADLAAKAEAAKDAAEEVVVEAIEEVTPAEEAPTEEPAPAEEAPAE